MNMTQGSYRLWYLSIFFCSIDLFKIVSVGLAYGGCIMTVIIRDQ